MSIPTTTMTPATWWYGKGRAVDVTRCLESLSSLAAAPGPAGLVTVSRGQVTVAFVAPLRAPLPPPWQPAGPEACIAWDAIPEPGAPDPQHPVCLVTFGTTGDEDLIVLNLTAFARLRITGPNEAIRGLALRWMLEIVATHPATKIGITADLWPGPFTSRIRPVAVGSVPDVDVLMIGGDLTYADRAHIAAASSCPILVDLGADAATSTSWTITCDADLHGEIGNGRNSMTATVMVPPDDVLDMCSDLLTAAPLGPIAPAAEPDLDPAQTWYDIDGDPDAEDYDDDSEIDFFAGSTDTTAGEPHSPDHRWSDPAVTPPAPIEPDPTAAAPAGPETIGEPTSTTDPHHRPAEDPTNCDQTVVNEQAQAVPVAPIWNRILGPVELCPPDGGSPGNREKRLNELTVFLQQRRWVTAGDIVEGPLGGAASNKTITQQMSMLRSRLGVNDAGRRALPPIVEGQYHLDGVVRSDWMEFDDLLQVIIERTETSRLIAAMDLVTGPPLGGIGPTEWKWADDLRDEIRSRVADAAVTLARRHHEAKQYSAAITTAEKGLWYDSDRQDLWEVAMTAALDGKHTETFRDLRKRYLAEIPSSDRRPAVFDLTGRLG